MPQMDGFDPNSVPDEALLPAGIYNGIITKSEIKPTSKGGSQYVFTVKLTDPHAAGKVLFWRIHKTVGSPDAKAIADRQLKSLCLATRVMAPRVTEQFHNITVPFNLVQTNRQDTGALVNEIKSVAATNTPQTAPSAINAQQGMIPAPVPQTAPQAAPAPWNPPPVPTAPVAPPWAAKPAESAK